MAYAWVIEHKDSKPDSPFYAYASPHANSRIPFDWSQSHMKALRFARREDAEAFLRVTFGVEAGHRIAEHGWD